MKKIFFCVYLISAGFTVFAQQRPGWIETTPESSIFLFFTGMGEAANEAAARNAAERAGFAAVARTYANLIQGEMLDRSLYVEEAGRVISDMTVFDDKTNSYTNAIVSDVKIVEYHTERGRTYKVWVLCSVSRQKAEQDIRDFAKNISDPYAPLLAQRQDTLAAELLSLTGIVKALAANPLHRAAAYYDSPEGRAGLYDYCLQRINTLADSVLFNPLESVTAEKGEVLNIPVRLSSSLNSRIGNLPCGVVVSDGGNPGLPEGVYTLGADNSFLLQIPTEGLEAGRYTARIELRMNAVAPSITRNPQTGFSFEVKPLNTVQIISRDESGPLAGKVAEIMERAGLMVVEGGGAYRALINITMNEERTANYYTLQPLLIITVELGRDGTPLVTYTKKYPLFRHVTRDEAYSRAYRNIEQDLSDNFAAQIRSLGK
jgi:hypothetical protein